MCSDAAHVYIHAIAETSNKQSVLKMPHIEQKRTRTEKSFCPKSMERIDKTNTEYETVWLCKICTVVVLSESGVQSHIKKCNYKSKSNLKPATRQNKKLVLEMLCGQKIEKPKKKPFCPESMERFDKTAIGYESVWACNKCGTVILSLKAVKAHVKRCS